MTAGPVVRALASQGREPISILLKIENVLHFHSNGKTVIQQRDFFKVFFGTEQLFSNIFQQTVGLSFLRRFQFVKSRFESEESPVEKRLWDF